MRKLKYLLVSMLSMMLIVLILVASGKVLASELNYSLDLSAITVGSDKDVITTNTFGDANNEFLTIETSYVTQRVKDNAVYCIEIKDSALSVEFNGVGQITVGFCSTGTTNESHFGITDENDNVIEASSAEATLLSTGDIGYYSVTGTTVKTVTYDITASGKYFLDSPSANTNRGCRIYSITMTDVLGDVSFYTVTYYANEKIIKTDSNVLEGSSITYIPATIPSGKYFEGWCTDSALENLISSTYTVTANVSLYAKFSNTKNYINTEESTSISGSTTCDNFAESIFNLIEINVNANTGMMLPTGNRNTYRLETSGSSSASRRLVTFTAPFDGKLTLWVASSNSGRTMNVYESSWNGTSVLSYEFTNADKNVLLVKEISITSGLTYYIGGSNGYYIYGLFATQSADQATVSLESQVNGNGASIRFVTTLTGVELTDITSWNVTFTLTGVENPVTTASFTTLYLAVAGKNGKDAVDGTFYLVYTITEIPTTANGKELTATMTITFADGSTKTTNASANTIAVTATE